MAFSRALTASFFVSLLILHLTEAQKMVGTNGALSFPTQTIDCGAACAGRCQLSKRPNLCKRACGSCCARCNCVPSGTSGNLEACPCYASLTTRHQIRKCP